MPIFAVLLIILLFPDFSQAQSKNAEYGPMQILNALRQLREQRGDTQPPKLATCLKNSSDGRWSDLQAHFYCWLKADQRACFTGAVDGELSEHPNLKGNYEGAFAHCLEAKGRAYGINFDRPLARLSLEQGEIFKNLLYRRPMLTKEEQKKILQAFYAGSIPERKPYPASVSLQAQASALAKGAATIEAPPPAATPAAQPGTSKPQESRLSNMAATLANPDVGEDEDFSFPRSCKVKIPHARTRQKPDSNSPVVAILDPAPIKVTGPVQASQGDSIKQWYPVEFQYRGKLTTAFLAVSLVECPQ